MGHESIFPDNSALHGAFGQARAEPEHVTIFHGWSRLTMDAHGGLNCEPMHGLYCGSTNFMTFYRLILNGCAISHRLSVQLAPDSWSTSGAILHSGTPGGSTEVRAMRKIGRGLAEKIRIKNNSSRLREVHLELSLSCPIVDDEYDPRMQRDKRTPRTGLRPRVVKEGASLRLAYQRTFGVRRSPAPDQLKKLLRSFVSEVNEKVLRKLDIFLRFEEGTARGKIVVQPASITRIHVRAKLGPREELKLALAFEPWIGATRMEAPQFDGFAPVPHRIADLPQGVPRVTTANSAFNLMIAQAALDLGALRLPVPGREGEPSCEHLDSLLAGIPRYQGLFGRDSLVAAWQSALFSPDLLESAVSRLEALQGDFRDLYYGDMTATPLWIIVLHEAFRWIGDPLIAWRHQVSLERCCEWILGQLKSGGGFIYYGLEGRFSAGKNLNQAWKDSNDAIVDDLGRVRYPPLALIEIQGYAYRALLAGAELLERVPSRLNPADLRAAAEELKRRFNQEFWVPSEKYFALALDAERQPLRAITSNPGHCLGAGILAPETLAQVSARLMEPDLFSGWGIRTLSSMNPAYDPYSYHRGSVWPFENALIARGLAGLGFDSEAHRIIAAQLNLATLFPRMRLPEVLTGHARSERTPTPGLYSYSNLLQAWSVSAILQCVQTLLGIEPRADQGVLYVDPKLPPWLPWIEIDGLKVGGSVFHLRFRREFSGETSWDVSRLSGEVEVRRRPGREGGDWHQSLEKAV